MVERIPSQRAGDDDARAFREYGSNGLGEQPQTVYQGAIGGTYHVSTKLSPEQALTGGYQPINGDTMPPCPGEPYRPKN